MSIKRFAVIGYPVSHSLSPIMFHWIFNSLKIDAEYKKIEVKKNELPQIINKIKDQDLDGINVTIPHKEAIMQYVDDPVGMPDVNKAWTHLRKEMEGDGKTISMVIKDYIDGMEKIMKKYSRKLRPLFTDYTKNRTLNVDPDSGDVPQWDELVVNNFTIKKIHVGQEYAEDFQDDDDIDGFPFQTWNDDAKLSDHITKIVKKGK